MATVPAVAFSIILFCDIMMLLLFTLIFQRRNYYAKFKEKHK